MASAVNVVKIMGDENFIASQSTMPETIKTQKQDATFLDVNREGDICYGKLCINDQ